MQAAVAYEAGADGHGITVGIIDTGITSSSPEFAGRISAKSTDATGLGRKIDDQIGHGTGVASIIGAARDGKGVMGVAFQSSLLVLRSEDPQPCTECQFSFATVSHAIDLAVDGGARVINMSLGSNTLTEGVRTAIRNAAQKGVIVVIAAGNDGALNPSVFAQVASDPQAAGLVLVVGSVNADGKTMSSFSNRAGAWANYFLVAPGKDVPMLALWGGTTTASGTSFSAPQVSGAAALLAQAFPKLTGKEIVKILLDTAVRLGDGATYGQGRLSLEKAMAPIGSLSLPGSGVPLPGAQGASLSAPFGDAALTSQSLSGLVALDSYRRAYRFNLRPPLRVAPQGDLLWPVLSTRQQARNLALGAADATFWVSRPQAPAVPASERLAPVAVLRQDRPELGSGVLTLRPRPDLAVQIGWRGASRIGAPGEAQPGNTGLRMLVAQDPLNGAGLTGGPGATLGLRLARSRLALGIVAEQGQLPDRAALPATPGVTAPRYSAWGISAERPLGPLRLGTALSFVTEQGSLLGSQWDRFFGIRGAETAELDGRAAWPFASGWQVAGGWRQAWTRAALGNGVVSRARLRAAASYLGLRGGSVLRPGDGFTLAWVRPLRVEAAHFALNLPVAYSYDTEEARFARRALDLVPRGREQAVEAAYGLTLGPVEIGTNLAWRHQPNNQAEAPDQIVGATTLRLGW